MKRISWLIIIILIVSILEKLFILPAQAEVLAPEVEEDLEVSEENTEIKESILEGDITKDEDKTDAIKIPLDIDYEIIKSFYISDTFTDENEQLLLVYVPEKQYSVEVVFNYEYEEVEIFVNGDPVVHFDSVLENKAYSCNFTFTEEPSNVVFTTIGNKKQENTITTENVGNIKNITDDVEENYQNITLLGEEIRALRFEIEMMQAQIDALTEMKTYSFQNVELVRDVLESEEMGILQAENKMELEKIDVPTEQPKNPTQIVENDEMFLESEEIESLRQEIQAMKRKIDVMIEQPEPLTQATQTAVYVGDVPRGNEEGQTEKVPASEIPWRFIATVLALAYVAGQIIKNKQKYLDKYR